MTRRDFLLAAALIIAIGAGVNSLIAMNKASEAQTVQASQLHGFEPPKPFEPVKPEPIKPEPKFWITQPETVTPPAQREPPLPQP
jgi:hypothetical protein